MKHNMKIEINADQPLDDVVKELERLGFKHSGWYGVKSNSPILVVEVGRYGNYEYYNHLFFTYKFTHTLQQLREMK